MKKYDSESKCEKCGCGMCATRWLPKEYGGHGRLPIEIPDKMERTCNNCGFKWYEIPLSIQPYSVG